MMRTLLMLCLLTFAAGAGRAAEEMRCALAPDGALGLAESAAFNLLGVELSKTPGLALLERAEVAKVMKERSLGLALAAGGVGERRVLGALLKARLLVILRAGERQVQGKLVRFISLVACDADSGIRMLADEVAWNDGAPAGTVAALARDVRTAQAKLAEKLEVVVAVPPLVSGDLTHRYDVMQDAYAQVLSGQFASVPGLQVVELAEAQALHDEQRLGGGEAARRPLAAYFVSGRYSNSGEGAARRIELSLELKQGERAVATAAAHGLAPQADTAFLNAKAGEFAGKMLMGRKATFDAGAEARELERKADTLAQLGEDARALGLLEAALLIRPGEAELHRKAAERCGAIADASFYDPDMYGLKRYREGARKGIAALMRGVEHLESYLFAPATLTQETIKRGGMPAATLRNFWLCGRRIFEFRKNDPEVDQMVSELGKARRALILAAYELMAARKLTFGTAFWETLNDYEDTYKEMATAKGSITTVVRNESWAYLDFYLRSCPLILETPEEACRERLRIIEIYRKAFGEDAVNYCEPYVTRFLPTNTPEYQSFLSQQHALPGAKWQAFIRKIQLAEMARAIQAKKDKEAAAQPQAVSTPKMLTTQPKSTPTPSGGDYQIVPIPEVPRYPAGWIPCGTAGDLIWKRDRVCVMRQKGKLETLMTATDEDPVVRATFDGRYAWVVMRNRLVLLDPVKGRLGEVAAKDGLPPGEMMAAPLAPGRVCVVGAFDRAWCAVVEFASGKGRVDVFHEARLKEGDWKDPGVAFQPAFMTTLRDKEHPEAPRVLVGRYMVGRGSHLPLLIDPARRKVEVVPERISNMIRVPGVTEHEGSAYWTAANTDFATVDGITARREKPSDPRSPDPNAIAVSVHGISLPPIKAFTHLVRFGPPQWRPETVFNNVPPTFALDSQQLWEQAFEFVGFIEGRCYVFNANGAWWADLEHGKVVELKGAAHLNGGGNDRVFHSNHYGLVLMTHDGCSQFQPTFDPARLASEAGPGGGRKVSAKDPLEEHPIVLRLYKNWLHAPDQYTTITVPVSGERIRMEADLVPENTAMVVTSSDQRDHTIASLMRNSSWLYVSGSQINKQDGSQFPIATRDSLIYYKLDPNDATSLPTPEWIALRDALGHPLADTEIQVGYCPDREYYGIHNGLPRFLSEPLRTDAKGQIRVPCILQPSGNIQNKSRLLAIHHPEIGSMMFCNWLDGQLQTINGIKIVRLPVVARQAPEFAQAMRGQVVDRAGKPIAGALVWCRIILPPGGGYQYAAAPPVVCDRDGRFTFYPRFDDWPKKTLPAGTRFIIKVRHPERHSTPEFSAILETGKEHLIHWEEGLEPHRIVVKDENGRELNARQAGLNFYYVGTAAEQAEAERSGFNLIDPRTYAMTSAVRQYYTEENPLRRGCYTCFTYGYGSWSQTFEVTAKSPREITVKVGREQLNPSRAWLPPVRPAAHAVGRPTGPERHQGVSAWMYFLRLHPASAYVGVALLGTVLVWIRWRDRQRRKKRGN